MYTTKQQAEMLQARVGKYAWLLADDILGVDRERVFVVSVNTQDQTVVVSVPNWGREVAGFGMFDFANLTHK